MNTLLFDTENGSKSIGGEQEIQNLFGNPVIRPTSWADFKSVMGVLFERKQVEKKFKIGTQEVTQNLSAIVRKSGVDVDAIVIDTTSALINMKQAELKAEGQGKTKDTMTLNKYGELKDAVDSFATYVNQFPCHAILTVHAKPEKDEELGIQQITPQISGSSRIDFGKHFDFVLYADSKKNGDNREFFWVTKKDERYQHAKDRSQLLADMIPQDFNLIFDAAKQKGWDYVKVLVIGSPGSGKTLSLKKLGEIEWN